MKKLILAATALAALGAATPASAQLGGIFTGDVLQRGLSGIFGSGGSARLERLDDRIEQAVRRGEISSEEARRLHVEFEQLRRLDRDLREDGLTRDERIELERRTDQLERRIEDARLNRGGRFKDDARFEDEDRDRKRRYERDDRRNGCPPGLAKKNNGCLPPGLTRKNGRGSEDRDRSQGEYRGGYRDNDGFIYRRQADGTTLQIDRRTGAVVRVIGRR